MTTFVGTNGSDFQPGLLGLLTALGDDEFHGLAGDDFMVGMTGNDYLEGGAGADFVYGGVVLVSGLSLLGFSADGNDTAGYAQSTAGVTINLGVTTTVAVIVPGLLGSAFMAVSIGLGGHAAGDRLAGINNLVGSVYNDHLVGNDNANRLEGGAGNDLLNGASGNDILIGGDGNDQLLGGAGYDHMTGGKGNDLYSVNSALDVYVELAGQGTDTVGTSVSLTLAAGASIESLQTTRLDGLANLNLTGNEIAQRVLGNNGNNIIDGKLGNDTLTGLLGEDTFRFTTAYGPSNVDKIADFDVADDTIALDNAIFAALGLTGALDATLFKDYVAGVRDADDAILYNSNTGSLFYDPDGIGGSVAIKFASVTPGLALTAADFLVI